MDLSCGFNNDDSFITVDVVVVVVTGKDKNGITCSNITSYTKPEWTAMKCYSVVLVIYIAW